MIEKLYTVEEVAELASVTGRTIRNYLKSGRLVGRKIGGQWRFPESEVQRLLTGGPMEEMDEPVPSQPSGTAPAPQEPLQPAPVQAVFPSGAPATGEESSVHYPQPPSREAAPPQEEQYPTASQPYATPAPLPTSGGAPVQRPESGAPISFGQFAAGSVDVNSTRRSAPQQPTSSGETHPADAPPARPSEPIEPERPNYIEYPPPTVDINSAQTNPFSAPIRNDAPQSVPPPVPGVQQQSTFAPPQNTPAPPPAYPAYLATAPAQENPKPAPNAPAPQPGMAYAPYPIYGMPPYPVDAAGQPVYPYYQGQMYGGYSPYGFAPYPVAPPPEEAAAQSAPVRPQPPTVEASEAEKVEEPLKAEDEPEPPQARDPWDIPELSDVGKRVGQFISEVHDCSYGPQVCAVIDLNQSLASAKATSERLSEIALQESDGSILCQSFVEFDERYYMARYTLFGTSSFLYRCIKLIG